MALGLVFVIPQAEAAFFDFSYTLSGGGVLAGQLDGTLQADNNTLFVNSVPDFVTFNGSNGPSLPFVSSVDDFINITPGSIPTLTLDGSFMDFIACTNNSCVDGFAFAVGNGFAAATGLNSYNSGNSFGTVFEPYNAANWKINIRAVPTPTTTWLLC